MKDFTFYNPTRIEFGKEKENNIGAYISEFGYKRVLIVYGSERIKTNGLFDKVAKSLKEQNIELVEIGGVISNPLISKVNEALTLLKDNKVDAILGVGGGSVVDTAKAIAAGAKYQGDVWDFFSGKATVQDALPIFAVLTLAATGTEMDEFGVVMNDETKQKYTIISKLLNPKVSVINPDLMSTVTNEYLAYSAVDITAHCLDLYFTASYLPDFNKSLIENIIKTVIRTTEILLNNPDDYNARAEFAWASTMALNGNTFVGVEGNSYDSHLIEHSMSALFNVAHGAGLAISLPAWMKWHNKKNPERYERFAREIFGVGGVDQGINKLEEWFSHIGAPVRLEEANIPRESIKDIAENAFDFVALFGLQDFYPIETIVEILELA